MEAAADRLLAAVDGNEAVVLYGDYDVDGVTSVTLLTRILRAYGIDPQPFIPRRLVEGYGITRAGLEQCLTTAETEPDLLVALDCGTNSGEEIAWLREQGIEAVILDHHEPDPGKVASGAVALVNPKCGREFHYLCTAGVAFKVAHALLKHRPVEGFDLKEFLDVTAVGTVADIVPLEGENRIFVRKGLLRLDRTRHPGFDALKQVAKVPSPAKAGHIGFQIGPRINAAGRIDSASDALDLLLASDPESATLLAGSLDGHNRDRRQLEADILLQAEAQVVREYAGQSPNAIIVGGEDWHPGVVGIVASRISRRYHRPTLVIGFNPDGIGKGSGRSIPGINLFHGIQACDHLLSAGGGHAQAVGLTVTREQFATFRQAFEAAIAEQTTANPDLLVPRIWLDAEITVSRLDLRWLERFEQLEPYGTGNPQPVLLLRQVQPVGERWLKEKHLKLRLLDQAGGRPVEAIYFNAPKDLPPPPWDAACIAERNSWQGRESIQLQIRAIRAAE